MGRPGLRQSCNSRSPLRDAVGSVRGQFWQKIIFLLYVLIQLCIQNKILNFFLFFGFLSGKYLLAYSGEGAVRQA